jgi:hypothetical protein
MAWPFAEPRCSGLSSVRPGSGTAAAQEIRTKLQFLAADFPSAVSRTSHTDVKISKRRETLLPPRSLTSASTTLEGASPRRPSTLSGTSPPRPSSADWSSFEMNESRSTVRSFPPAHLLSQMMRRLSKYPYGFPSPKTSGRHFRTLTNGSIAHCIHAVCCQASLPLALWLSCGWMGLLGQWRTLAAAFCFLGLDAQTASARRMRGQSE